MDPKSPEFKALQDKWYAKLKDEGFNDAEQDETRLKQWHSLYFITHHTNFTRSNAGTEGGSEKKLDATRFRAQEEYYQLAGAFLHTHLFNCKKDRDIWEFHSNGVQVPAIYDTLKQNRVKVSLAYIRTLIKTLARVMVEECQTRRT